MKKTARILAIVFIAVFFSFPVHAESSDPVDQSWERFSFKLGDILPTLTAVSTSVPTHSDLEPWWMSRRPWVWIRPCRF